MRRWVKVFAIVPVLVLLLAGGGAQGAGRPQPSYSEWQERCAKLPSNRVLKGRLPPAELLPLQTFAEFNGVIQSFLNQCVTGFLAQTNRWEGKTPSPATFFNTNSGYFLKSSRSAASPIPFEPFAQKLVVPPGSEIYFHADLHGDIRSLLADLAWLNQEKYLAGFAIAKTNFYMILLGDYTDRGSYGTEVLYTIFRLKLQNPDHVFMARGNHEEVDLQSRYGFFQEGQAKYTRAFDPRTLLRAYDFLPVVIYLGSGGNFIQCNHGGMEPGYSPRSLLGAEGDLRFQLLGPLRQRRFLLSHPDWLEQADAPSREFAQKALMDFEPVEPTLPTVLGFMWNDFAVLRGEPEFSFDPGRAYVYGRDATRYLLRAGSSENAQIQAVFRGHQQSSVINPMMRRLIASKGAIQLWQPRDGLSLKDASIADLAKVLETEETRAIAPGSVWTFNVSPDSNYGEGCGYSFDAFGILKVAEKFPDWRLRMVNIPISR